MSSIARMWKCACMNFKKWGGNWRIRLVGTFIILFDIFNLAELNFMCADYGVKVTGWLFPLTVNNPLMLLAYGYCTVAFFSDAPFMDGHTLMWIARTGRMEWIVGQVVYVIIAALLLALFYTLSPILAVLPNVTLANDWSDCIYLIIDESPAGYSYVLRFSENFLDNMPPLLAMARSTLMVWLVNMFMGAVMLFLNYASSAYTGTIACGIISFMSYFSCFTGSLRMSRGIFYVSPVNWISLNYINWTGINEDPSPMYAITAMVVGSAIAFTLGVLTFCKRDIAMKNGGVLE